MTKMLDKCLICWMNLELWKIPLLCIRLTMGRTQILGPMVLRPLFVVKRIQTGKALSVFLYLFAGQARLRQGSISNGIVQHHDWLPTFLAMAGDPEIMEKLKKGYNAIGRTYKNHIDGFNLLPYLTGEVKE